MNGTEKSINIKTKEMAESIPAAVIMRMFILLVCGLVCVIVVSLITVISFQFNAIAQFVRTILRSRKISFRLFA